MLSLSANFTTALKKSGSLNYRYVVRMAIQEGDNDANNKWGLTQYGNGLWWFSHEPFDITEGATTYPCRGILVNPNIAITQKIDLKRQIGTVGGFSFSLIDDGLVADLDNYRVHNRLLEIYIGDSSLTNITDFLKVYQGIVKDYTIDNHIVTFNVENWQSIYQKDLPTNFWTPDDDTYSQQPDDIRNKRCPIVYGDRPFYYGNDAGATDLTNIANVHKMENNMTKTFYVGMDSSGKHVYLVAGHVLHTTDASFYRAWMFDRSLDRYVQINSSAVTFSTTGDGYTIVTIDNLPTVYDFWFPDGTISNEANTGTGSWANATNGCDKDWSTYAECVYETADGVGTARFDVDFPNYDGYQDDADISQVKLFVKTDFDPNGMTADYTYTILISTAENVADTQLSDLGNDGATKAGVANSINVECDKDNGGAAARTAKFYMIFKRIGYTVKEMFPVFVACKGRKASAAVGWFDGIAQNDLIENPVHVIGAIILDDLGLTIATNINSSNIDSGGFNKAYDDLTSSYKLAFTIYDKINSMDLLNKISFESTLVMFWGATNKVWLDKMNDVGSSSRTIYKSEIKGLPSIFKTKLIDIVNELDLKYKPENKTGEKQGKVNREDDRANTGSQAVYFQTAYKQMESDFVADSITAGLLADLWCKDDADSFWSTLHNVVEFETADFRGIEFYDGATFEPLYLLELLDVFQIDSGYDDVILCNGESWSGKQFKIFEIVRLKTILKIKAIEI